MSKAPKKDDSRAKALAGMTKAELIKTVKALDRKQTQLLNQLAKANEPTQYEVDTHPGPRTVVPAFPWSTCEGS